MKKYFLIKACTLSLLLSNASSIIHADLTPLVLSNDAAKKAELASAITNAKRGQPIGGLTSCIKGTAIDLSDLNSVLAYFPLENVNGRPYSNANINILTDYTPESISARCSATCKAAPGAMCSTVTVAADGKKTESCGDASAVCPGGTFYKSCSSCNITYNANDDAASRTMACSCTNGAGAATDTSVDFTKGASLYNCDGTLQTTDCGGGSTAMQDCVDAAGNTTKIPVDATC